MTDYRQMRPASDVRMMDGSPNAGGTRHNLPDSREFYYDAAPMSTYPMMLYRRTEHEQVQEWADAIADLKDKPMVVNRYNGYLCETCIAQSATEAEALAELGWDISPEAAHGIKSGLQVEASAKDERIAELEALLAAREPADEPVRRGPGRPPKAVDA